MTWLPMMEGDGVEAAKLEAQSLSDPRVSHQWDGRKELADLFAKTLALDVVAWDVYLLYPPGVTWQDGEPPSPVFWMHQLPAPVDAPGLQVLSPGPLARRIAELLGTAQPPLPEDIALRVQLKGLASVKRPRP